MTEDNEDRPELTEDEVVYLYERQMNFAILWVMIAGFAWIAAAILLFVYITPTWLGFVCGAACIIAGGFTQRLLAWRVKCPVCKAPVLAKIHSIFQSRSIMECPYCGAKLRN